MSVFDGSHTLAPDDGVGAPLSPDELRAALAGDAFSLAFQPILSASGRSVDGCEALLRWHDPARGHVPPGDVIPVAEASGLILELGDWVLRRACRQAARWRSNPISGLPATVWVNVSARQLDDPRFPARVAACLTAERLDGTALCLEVTEGSLVDVRGPTALAVMAELRALGVRLMLDDFGTGYSALSYLRQLPIDGLKLDRSFAAQLPLDASVAPIVGGVTGMAHALGLAVVAEGIETDAQLAAVQACGVDHAQGFLLGRPAPAEELAASPAGRRWHVPAPARDPRGAGRLNVGAVPSRPVPALGALLEAQGDALVAEAARRVYAAPAQGWFSAPESGAARTRWLAALHRDCRSGNYTASLHVSATFFRQGALAGATALEQHLFVTGLRSAVTRALRRAGAVQVEVAAAWTLFTALEHQLLLVLPRHWETAGPRRAMMGDAHGS